MLRFPTRLTMRFSGSKMPSDTSHARRLLVRDEPFVCAEGRLFFDIPSVRLLVALKDDERGFGRLCRSPE
jgi:hypothetical protein